VNYLARVEGEGAFKVVVRDGAVKSAELRLFEPPRFYEAFLRGRSYMEVPDITARICGICRSPIRWFRPRSEKFSASRSTAIARVAPAHLLREWIESHVLHIYMLHAPDSRLRQRDPHGEGSRRYRQEGARVQEDRQRDHERRGRPRNPPINVRIGGFYKVPSKRELAPLAEKLKWARDAALDTVRLVSTFDFPDCQRDYEFVALRHPSEYPFNEGRLVSNKGMDIPIEDYDATFEETHVEHSTALHSRVRARGTYFVGPLARYSLNYDR